MDSLLNWLLSQYADTSTLMIILEIVAVIFGWLSVWFAKKENILVFPTGIISTGIFVYILLKIGLLGDMLINAYFFSMSIYGWYNWTRKVDESHFIPITKTNSQERTHSALLFLAAVVFVGLVYIFFEKFNQWTAYVDIFTTALFFVGMWLMARKKIENWIYWIVGDVISVPLYLYKGLVVTSLQYVVFTIIAIYGYKSWKKSLNKNQQI